MSSHKCTMRSTIFSILLLVWATFRTAPVIASVVACRNESQLAADSSSIFRYRGRRLKATDWCALKCAKEAHVACEFNGDCGTINEPCAFVTVKKEEIIDSHNKLRNQFAMGQDEDAKGIKVSNMMALKWDQDMAFLAGCNLKLCPPQMKHDYCHITEKFRYAGQNLAWSKGKPNSCPDQANDMIDRWYAEIKLLTPEKIKALGKSFIGGGGYGHFTQLVWATTTHIGCAIYKKDTECMLACNYGPGGNFIGNGMFKEGTPASQCPAGVKKNKKYPGLCGGTASPIKGSMILAILILLHCILLFDI